MRSWRKPLCIGAFAGAVLLVTVLLGASLASSYSVSDAQFYDGLSDLSAFDASETTRVALDPLGGLRLSTNGTEHVSTWDTVLDFRGVNATSAGPLVGTLTLDATISAATTSSGNGTLRLKGTPLALSFDASNPVIAPSFDTSADAGDAFEIQGPSVIKIGSEYRMFYTGVAPDGYVQRVFEATSTNGTTWTKVRGPARGAAILDVGDTLAFDGHGLVRPSAAYDASSGITHLYYGALADDYGAIGAATSTDGVNWVKYEETTGVPSPVLTPGLPGMQDGYSVGEPSVVYDSHNRMFKMWYALGPGPDVGGRKVGYASSTNTTEDAFGAKWGKGGEVSMGGANGNWNGGWFSPGAYIDSYDASDAPQFRMVFAGKKLGLQPYKLMDTQPTADPSAWLYGGILLQNGTTGAWDENNVFWASMHKDAPTTYMIYYTGNGGTGDKARSAIGHATWGGGGGATAWPGNPILRASTPGARFDTNYTANGSLVRSVDSSGAARWVMLYAGRAAADLRWRIGAAVSTDAAAWTKIDGGANATRKSAIATGGAGTFDNLGAKAPSIASTDASGSSLVAVYTGIGASSNSFGMATATASGIGTWTRSAAAVLTPGGGTTWDLNEIAHPSLVGSGTAWRLYYAGRSGTAWSIGYATASAATGPWSKVASAVLTAGSAGEYDFGGALDPVVCYDGSAYRMWYTARESLDTTTVERMMYATSSDGVNWTKSGLAVCPSEEPYRFDEVGVRPSGAAWDAASGKWQVLFDGIDRGNTGVSAGLPTTINWLRIGRLTGAAGGFLPDGSGVYQCEPTGTPAPGYFYEFKGFDWDSVVPTGTEAQIALSFYPAYTTPNGQPADVWSKYFSLDDTNSMPYLPLTTQKVRWRAAFTRDGANTNATPDLSKLIVRWAPVHFETSGTALSIPVQPASGRYIDSWQQLNVTVDGVTPTTTVSATVLAEDGQVLLGPIALANGANAVDLTGLPAGIGSIRVRLDLAGTGETTPYVKNWNVTYTTTDRGPISEFRTMSVDTANVQLTWTEPTYPTYLKTKILSRTDTFPVSANDTDAVVIYEATGTAGATMSLTATGSPEGKVYYYTAYTTDTTAGTAWSPPAYAIGVPARPVTNLSAALSGLNANLTWIHGTTVTTSDTTAWRGTRILRQTDATVTTPYDTSAYLVGGRDCTGTATTDGGLTSGHTYRYGAWEHYGVYRGLRMISTYSQGSTATLGVSGGGGIPTGPKSVTRVAGGDRFATGVAMARYGWDPTFSKTWPGVRYVVVASGEDRAIADPLSAAGLCGAYDAPLLLMPGTGALPGSVRTVLAEIASRNRPLTVMIVGGTAAVPAATASAIDAIPYVNTPQRIAGGDRYATSAAIAKRIVAVKGKAAIPGVLLICAENPLAYYDALAAGPISFKNTMPMLACKAGSIPSPILALLTGTGPLAGKARFAMSAPTFLGGSASGATRLVTSTDRFVAATQIANAAKARGWLVPTNTGVAAKLPDALGGGAFMGRKGGMLLYTTVTSTMQATTRNWITANKAAIYRGWVFGGTASVPAGQQTQFYNLIK